MLGFRVLDILDRCRALSQPDDVVVCGRRADRNRYRLPLPSQRAARRLAPETCAAKFRARRRRRIRRCPAASSKGQRLCGEDEMAEFGYGQGRNPLTFFGNIVARIADPEADIATPPPSPQ